jgi:hypothetical protein
MVRRAGSSTYSDNQYSAEIGLLDENGQETPQGDVYDFSNDRPLPELEALRPLILKMKSLIADRPSAQQGVELVIDFKSSQQYDPGDYETPPYDDDVREITRAYISGGIHGPKIPVYASLLDDIYANFENQIAKVDVGGNGSDEDFYRQEKYDRDRDQGFAESAVTDIAAMLTEDPDIFNELIFVNVTGTTSVNEVLNRLKAAGYQVGNLEVEQVFVDGLVGNLEVDEVILSELEHDGYWEVDLDGITISAESGSSWPQDTTIGETSMTPNAAKLKEICENEAAVAVLFISSPKNGDHFKFGTIEELENEKEALENDNEGDDEFSAQITDTRNLLNWLDFEAYEGDQPVLEL